MKRETETKEELKALKKQLKAQEKELVRKEKALAELAAIITLQKKQRSCCRTPGTTDCSRAEADGMQSD